MTTRDIRDALSAAIEALETTAYVQDDTVAPPPWTRSEQVLDPLLQPTQGGHLAFSVLARSSPVVDQRRDTPGDVVRLGTNLEVAFGYRVRPTEQDSDYGLAFSAALDLVKLVNDEDAWGADTDVSVLVVDAGTPRVSLDGGVLLLTTTYVVQHDEEI